MDLNSHPANNAAVSSSFELPRSYERVIQTGPDYRRVGYVDLLGIWHQDSHGDDHQTVSEWFSSM